MLAHGFEMLFRELKLQQRRALVNSLIHQGLF